ncbi:hypothetical protein FKW77_006781 [Venturia effusa]|uniref:Uncharacterized protein n=1 Tax=Venturia effusa TaxID=50376 RepID=A0A517L1H6_9PEZI|nr:hypothetical protein FKW77_006781 [Venturia effusa]
MDYGHAHCRLRELAASAVGNRFFTTATHDDYWQVAECRVSESRPEAVTGHEEVPGRHCMIQPERDVGQAFDSSRNALPVPFEKDDGTKTEAFMCARRGPAHGIAPEDGCCSTTETVDGQILYADKPRSTHCNRAGRAPLARNRRYKLDQVLATLESSYAGTRHSHRRAKRVGREMLKDV